MQQHGAGKIPSDAVQRAWVALQRAAPLLRERVDDRLKAEGLPDLADYSILWALDRAGGPVRPRDLGLLLFIPRYQVSRMIERLVGEGLVERQSCPKDRRGHLLALTPKGKATRLAAWAIYAPAMAEAMGGVSEAEALKLAELINRLAGAQASGGEGDDADDDANALPASRQMGDRGA